MDCYWTGLLNVLPVWMRESVNCMQNKQLQEVRLRVGKMPVFTCKDKQITLQQVIVREDLEFCINTASRYSPWASQTISKGFITVTGGHRIGICGTVASLDGRNITIRDVSSLCIRVARQLPGIGEKAANISENILILGRPGSGKSTLLRDIVRCKSRAGKIVCVVDERQELFPCIGAHSCFDCDINTDILSGCAKAAGIDMAIRVMNPHIIAVDEVTAKEDCDAMINAGWCGITLIATAHASSKHDYLERPIYRPLVECGLFNTLLILQPDKSWRTERIHYDD